MGGVVRDISLKEREVNQGYVRKIQKMKVVKSLKEKKIEESNS